MAGTTEHYGLAVGVVTDDIVEPDHHNRVAATLDRVLGGALRSLVADGAYSGWLLNTSGAVTAGEGLVAGCWCKTTADAAITGLTSGATNHVFARSNSGSAPDGTVDFAAQLSAEKPAGAVYLGTAEVDSGGVVTAVDNAAAGVDRNCLRLEIGQAAGSGTVASVPAAGTFSVEITHALSLLVPGAIAFSSQSANFTWELQETWRGDGFKVSGTNNGAEAADLVYAWTRRGLVG
ncbi:hypothetical protein LLH23_02425 [bacterium]|nr:hypothetical protein [bacterium]